MHVCMYVCMYVFCMCFRNGDEVLSTTCVVIISVVPENMNAPVYKAVRGDAVPSATRAHADPKPPCRCWSECLVWSCRR